MDLDDIQTALRLEMVQEQIIARGIYTKPLIEAFLSVPRHMFVPEEKKNVAYEDRPILIGEGQTISQPYVVALMLDLVLGKKSENLLEIGSGTGYLLAIASHLYSHVVGVERVEKFVKESKERLIRLGIESTDIVCSDASEEFILRRNATKFDAIVVSCACLDIPHLLFKRLQAGGKLVVPLGDAMFQELVVYTKNQDGSISRLESHGVVRFVPMVQSAHGLTDSFFDLYMDEE